MCRVGWQSTTWCIAFRRLGVSDRRCKLWASAIITSVAWSTLKRLLARPWVLFTTSTPSRNGWSSMWTLLFKTLKTWWTEPSRLLIKTFGPEGRSYLLPLLPIQRRRAGKTPFRLQETFHQCQMWTEAIRKAEPNPATNKSQILINTSSIFCVRRGEKNLHDRTPGEVLVRNTFRLHKNDMRM